MAEVGPSGRANSLCGEHCPDRRRHHVHIMRLGFRHLSIRKRIIRAKLGIRAPRGWGWATNPKRALYNGVYHRTTWDPLKVLAKLFS
jgi:hypothetical protein